MGVKTVLPVLTLLCVIGAVWSCSKEKCKAENKSDDNDNPQDECCKYFRDDECCSQEENDYLTLLFRLTLGLSIGIFGLLVIISVIIVCCCCCICCD